MKIGKCQRHAVNLGRGSLGGDLSVRLIVGRPGFDSLVESDQKTEEVGI